LWKNQIQKGYLLSKNFFNMVGHFSIDKKYEARAGHTTTILLTAGIRGTHHVLVWPNIFLYSTSTKSQKS
jgi:hypothetical protein